MSTTFAELGLNEQILAGVEALGFTQPTPVQSQAIPLVLEGRDLVASAQTGTGKTAAFALPALQRIMGLSTDDPTPEVATSPATADTTDAPEQDEAAPKRRRRRRRKKGTQDTASPQAAAPARPLALVVTPTRELAQQIERVVTTVCEHTNQRSVIVMGGTRFDRQLKQLSRGCDLLVATPGRLIDLMEHNHVDLGRVHVFVLDEADRMLDMGFWPSVRRIIQALPAKRQNLLFSATIPPSIKGTIDAMLTNPATVEIARVGETADTVEEHLCPVTQGQKTQLLQELVKTGGAEPDTKPERVLVFCRTKNRVDDVSKTLKSAGFKTEVMHADRPQKARDKALERFREGAVQLLVATDVMSRGIDVSGIDAVVNFDVPMDPEDYVHRIGRTGRAGATGHAYTFVAPDEISPLREIEYFTKKLIPVWDLEGFDYDSGRIVPNPTRSTSKPMRTMFSGSKSRRGFGGPSGGRFGRHY
ncbi:MAG: DEAD/DEAH box helicase [Atopobiaceae bacterium]|nr:DEAD/DEAH box helicase [Atopobiaceae bacterium]